MARETIRKILQDPSLKAHKRGIVVKMICPDTTYDTPRNYMIVLLDDKSVLFNNNLWVDFAVNLSGYSSYYIGVSKDSYIVKPTVQDYLELWEMYTRYKSKNDVDNKNNKG